MGAKQETQTGSKYFGSIAQALCVGPVDILHQIGNGDVIIWEGPIFRTTSMDGQGKTTLTTTIGVLHFYWGTMTQTTNSLLSGLKLNGSVVPMSPFHGVCYAVLDNFQFGGTPAPPTLSFLISKFGTALTALSQRVTRINVTNEGSGYTSVPTVQINSGGGADASAHAEIVGGKVRRIVMDNFGHDYTSTPAIVVTGGGGSGATAVAYLMHEIYGDAHVPEVLYEAFTNTFWGMGLSPDYFDLDSFVDVALALLSESTGLNPLLDENQTLRDFIGKLFEYVQAFPYFHEGKIFLKLIRKENAALAPELTDADFADEPKLANRGLNETWNLTRVIYRNGQGSRDFSEEVATWDDPANAVITGQLVDKEFQFPWIIRHNVANRIVKRKGIQGGVPPLVYELKLIPEHGDLVPGQLVRITWPKLGLNEEACRIIDITRGTPEEPEVRVQAMVELAREEENQITLPDDQDDTPPVVDDDGTNEFPLVSVAPKIAVIPSALRPEFDDGFLAVFDRSTAYLIQAKVYWTWDPSLKSYTLVATQRSFPLHAIVLGWHKIRQAGNWLLRIRIPNTWDFADFSTLMESAMDIYGVAARRSVRLGGTPSNVHQVNTQWLRKVLDGYLAAVSADVYDIEIVAEAFGTEALELETVADPQQGPTENIYFGEKEDFAIVGSDSIQFERNAPNPPNNPDGSNPDTDLMRYVKVAVGSPFDDQLLADVDPVIYDRDDTTMSPDGTFDPDWGARAWTTYELFDWLAGQYFLAQNAAGYSDVSDIDDALGNFYNLLSSDTEDLLWTSIDEVLGVYFDARNNIYNDAA